MATVTITIPNSLITELNTIAVGAGFANAKTMTIAYLRAQIRGYRSSKAIEGLREAAEKAADTDTEVIA